MILPPSLQEQLIHAIDKIAIISTANLSGKITYVNNNFCAISGYSREELLGQNHRIVNSGLHTKEFFQEMWQTIGKGLSWYGELRNKSKTGGYYWVEAFIIPTISDQKVNGYLSFRFDITQEKQMQELLENEKLKSLHMGRLATIGELAGGIAHEVNNPLSIIAGNLEMIQRRISKTDQIDLDKLNKAIDRSIAQTTRIAKIIQGLREFSRADQGEEFESVNLKRLMQTVEGLCSERLRNHGVQFENVDCDQHFSCNPIQIEQVLANLISNASDAVKDLENKWVRVESNTVGDQIEIYVTDSGPGIDPAIAEKIMEPFFTTKPVGKGTGLGLSISKGIIEKHGGTLTVDKTCPNTRFTIKLPLSGNALLKSLDADQAIASHSNIRFKFLSINSNHQLNINIVSNDSQCSLGRWLDKANPHFCHNTSFRNLKREHKNFHDYAGKLAIQLRNKEISIETIDFSESSEYNQRLQQLIDCILIFKDSLKFAA